jgi:hypothetical protein
MVSYPQLGYYERGEQMSITRFEISGGAAIIVEDTGERGEMGKARIAYEILDGLGEVLSNGADLFASPLETTPFEWAGSLAAFIFHDREIVEFSPAGSWGRRYPDSARALEASELIFGSPDVGAWADDLNVEADLMDLQERGEDAGPDEGDYVLEDAGPLGSRTSASVYGEGWIGEYPDDETALEDIRALMRDDNFYPSIWRLSDHGNYHLVD